MSYKSFQQCLLMTYSVALATFSFAYNSYLINGPLDHIRIWINIESSFKEGAMMTSFNFGGLVGCIIGILIVKSTSRRLMLYLIDALLIIGTAGLNIQNYQTFIFFRMIAGIGSGLTTLVTPMFLKEIIPTQIYGVLGGQNLVLLSLGTIVQSFCALGFKDVKGQTSVDMSYWRFYLLPPIIICITRSLLLKFYFPYESPIFSIQKGNVQAAEEFLEHIYQDEDVSKLKQDIENLVNKRNVEKTLPGARVFLGIMINIFYSNSGITPIISYSTKIFQQVTTIKVAQILTIGMSIIKFIFYSTGAQLTQKFGRRMPLIIGTGILCAVLISTGLSSSINDNQEYNDTTLKSIVVVYIVIAIYLYFGVFFNTFGAIIPLYTPEILSGIYLTVALIFQWSFNITITFLFPVIRDSFGMCYTFYYFGIMMGVATIYFIMFVKETKNLDDKEIDALWQIKTSKVRDEKENLIQ
ncbi:unnamed protein product [Paramecium pentaurelia]|uniref:Major facilitator superfamily (MFS) profile domain-containing protein n=1 Tax=Paramecium pentaurelia TaxID=43138 RepID=A0A8S1TH75_9CILI|nr:unnamed protein product [Paramecium pentaurelia]